MGELYNPFPKLPKNIRQIGDRDDVVKLYVEDYVNTYLKRLYPAGGQDLRIGLLLGNVENHEGTPYIFVDGALEMEDVTVSGEKVTFSEAAWKKAYQSIEETFPKRTVQGWFLCGAPGCALSPLNYWKQHGQYFGGKNQLMYLNEGIDGDESVYITSDDGFYRLKGYSIYYERNQMMQDYMILRKDARRVESGTNDRVIRDFRQRMEGRRREAVSRRGTVRTLGMLVSALSVAVLAGGVVMFNNYQKMKEMESVLVSVLPSGAKGWQSYGKGGGDKLVVEEIKGSIYPTEAPPGQAVWNQSGGSSDEREPGAGVLGQTDSSGQFRAESGVLSESYGAAPGTGAGDEGQAAGTGTAESGGRAADGQGAAGQAGGSQAADSQAGGNQAADSQAGGGQAADGQAGGSQAAASQAGGGRTADGQAGGGQTAGGQKAEGQAAGGQALQADSGLSEALPEEDSAAVSAVPQGGGGGNSAVAGELPVTNMKPGETYTVQDGETLYGICFKLYDNLKYLDDICALNQLDDQNRIIAGQKLILPDLTGLQ